MACDVLVVCIDTTGGWIAAAEDLAASLRRAGASVEVAHTGPVPRVRTLALTDLVEARLARRAAVRGLAEHAPGAVVLCSITAALLWPAPGAIFLDSMAAENRPGRHGIWQRPVERRRLAQAPLLLPWSDRTLAPAAGRTAPAVVLSPPVEVANRPLPFAQRDIAAVTYAGNPVKRRLGLVLAAWARARRDGETLVVAGTDLPGDPPPGVRSVGRVGRSQFSDLLRRARVFVAAPIREDYGIAALEALGQGCALVTTPSPGPYPGLALARDLDGRLVGDDLAAQLRTALDEPRLDYPARAAERLGPFTRATFDRTVADSVLTRLMAA